MIPDILISRNDIFRMDKPVTPEISHVAATPAFDDLASTVIPVAEFDEAASEITQWEGYSPTPLYGLASLAKEVGVAAILYKHEGPRFGLGSFKALGGAYAAQKVLARELSRLAGKVVSLTDVRNGACAGEADGITLVSATDGNHGRSLAWGCNRFGAQCRIYIHANVSPGRERAMQDVGAEVVRISGDYDESVKICREEFASTNNDWTIV